MNNPIEISVPGGEVLYNALDENPSPETLGQDIVAIRLQDGTFIDVSWYPQFDPNGAYTVAHISADWEHRLSELRTRQIAKVVEAIQLMARGAFLRADPPAASTTATENPRATWAGVIRYRPVPGKASVYA